MSKYIVYIGDELEIEVEADSENEAENKAIRKVDFGDFEEPIIAVRKNE